MVSMVARMVCCLLGTPRGPARPPRGVLWRGVGEGGGTGTEQTGMFFFLCYCLSFLLDFAFPFIILVRTDARCVTRQYGSC
ncbi:hypothetical protein BO70DRAFT_163650 [Aspergillus heteromorphus CBS 117.55]|uniref:Uncharacterized protein n=1 Tax=Aspergillus heteromorphus CBS 117.55 TaxID=1448321 RepID=A0A317WTV8_9EURO|nr:uncharacterized protein BO70DRAFT_163650 [Aspergillus heteromorphus CBS 117.55]PWY89251.1 hypothetical protein BO70DRAFT_163650 [Aspergillus heteromorphus CBS 117.55]